MLGVVSYPIHSEQMDEQLQPGEQEGSMRAALCLLRGPDLCVLIRTFIISGRCVCFTLFSVNVLLHTHFQPELLLVATEMVCYRRLKLT